MITQMSWKEELQFALIFLHPLKDPSPIKVIWEVIEVYSGDEQNSPYNDHITEKTSKY